MYTGQVSTDINYTVGHCEMCQLCKPKKLKGTTNKCGNTNNCLDQVRYQSIFEDEHYLVLVDYMSKFPIMRRITNETSTVVIQSIKAILSEFGNVKEIVSDNSPHFKSFEFEDPYHYQANGQVR